MAALSNNAAEAWGTPHAFHLNLPPNHIDQDGVPYITKFAHKKSRMIVELALSIKLTEDMFATEEEDEMEIDNNGEMAMDETNDSKETLVSAAVVGLYLKDG